MQCTEGTENADHGVLCANHTSRFSPRTAYSQQEDLPWDGSHLMEPGQRSYSCTPRSIHTKEATGHTENQYRPGLLQSLFLCGQVWVGHRTWRYSRVPCPLGVHVPIALEYSKCSATGKCQC